MRACCFGGVTAVWHNIPSGRFSFGMGLSGKFTMCLLNIEGKPQLVFGILIDHTSVVEMRYIVLFDLVGAVGIHMGLRANAHSLET